MQSAVDMFMVKKIVSAMIYPFFLSLVLIVAGVVLLWIGRRVRAGKVLAASGLALLLLQSLPVVPNEMARRLEYAYPPVLKESEIPGGIQWVVVLSGASINNEYVPATSQNIGDTLHRVVEGVLLAGRFPKAKLLLSGGSLEDNGPAALVMARLARELGVEPGRIVLEEESKDTEQQARSIATIVGKDRVLLVTSALHMPRSMMLFRSYGVDAVAAPASHVSTTRPKPWRMLLPSPSAVARTEACAHELLGMAWFKLKQAGKQGGG